MIRAIIQFFCMVVGHPIKLGGNAEDETLHYRCDRCGQQWPYYF